MFRLLRLRPPHGWNAVAWELAIVVLGVLIALAAQQWAEERSWAGKVRQSTATIRDEVANHYAWSVEWRVVEPCILAQIDALHRRVMESGDRLEPEPTFDDNNFRYVLRLPSKEYSSSAWNAAQLDGVTSRLDPDLRRELSSHYEQVRIASELTERNGVDYRKALTLSYPLRLDPSVRYSILTTLDELRGRAEFVDIESGQMIDHVTRMGMIPSAQRVRADVERYGTYQFCKKHGLPMRPYAAAMRPVAN